MSRPQSAIRNPQSAPAPSPQPPAPRPRRGLTLIELLVVIIILTTLVAAAIPLLAPADADRRLREASRGINTYITGAQARAISLARPYGISLKRLSADTGRAEDNGVCLEVFYVEQQPPFSGFDRNSKVCVSNLKQFGLALIQFVRDEPGQPKQFGLPMGIFPELFPENMFRPGDLIEINGTIYELIYGSGQQAEQGSNVTLNKNGYFAARGGAQNRTAVIILARPINNSGQQLDIVHDSAGFPLGADRPRPPVAPARPPSPYWTAPAPYRILRQPTLASDEPYQLPEGTAIDLRASGLGSETFFYNPDVAIAADRIDNSDSVIIMFAPEGGVYRLSYNLKHQNNAADEIVSEPVSDNLYLLVGDRANIPAPPLASDPTLQTSAISAATTEQQRAELRKPINWLSGNSRWVVIGSQSGRIVTIENGFVDFPLMLTTLSSPATEQNRNKQITTAREFTREMAQLGGR